MVSVDAGLLVSGLGLDVTGCSAEVVLGFASAHWWVKQNLIRS